MKHNLYLALGSNLGDRQQYLHSALELLAQRVGNVVATSSAIETLPVGFESENLFLNAAAHVETELGIDEVLAATQQMERELGRPAKSDTTGYSDRTIDIDLLAYDDVQLQQPGLTLPHPAMTQRRFVLQPLAEIAPELVLPGQAHTVKELLDELNRARIEEFDTPERAADIEPHISRLLAQLSSKTKSISAERLAHVVSAPNIHLYLLYDECDTVSGMATLAVDTLLTGTKAWVEDVVVDSRCRCRGYARQMLAFLEQEGRRLGAASLNLTSRPAREAANRLYRRAGFVQRETNVYKLAL